MDKKRTENNELRAEEKRMEEIRFDCQQVNDYPLSDKNLVVSPQIIPLSTDELPIREIEDI